MKKVIALVLSLVLVVAFTMGCKKAEEPKKTETPAAAAPAEQKSAETPAATPATPAAPEKK